MKISKVIIVINEAKPHARKTAQTLKSLLDAESVAQEWLPALPPRKNIYGSLRDAQRKSADLVIACGGDGTLIQTAHRFRGSRIPILGINIGYLGFITSIPGNRVRQEMRRILDAEFVISQRTALALEIEGKKKTVLGWALNDALIVRGDNPHLIGISA